MNDIFTFKNLKKQYETALAKGYQFFTCKEYMQNKGNMPDFSVINRVDIDFKPYKTSIVGKIFKSLGIKGTFL